MKSLKFLADNIKGSFKETKEFGIYDFLMVENVLHLLSIISPDLNPNNAYVLLRGYQIINHSIEDEKLFLLQQARIKFLVYSSRMQWEQDLGYYLDSQYDSIRLYNIEDDKLVKTTSCIPFANREEKYLSYLQSSETQKSNLSLAKAGKYKFYRQDKSSITVQIPEWPVINKEETNSKLVCAKSRREKISISYNELLATALEMKGMVPTDYCYEVLQKNTIENVRKVHGGEDVSIDGVTNIVGMVGSGKTTLLKVLCYYLANHGYRTAIILNTVSEVVEIYKYLKKFNLSVAPLVGKSNQEKYVYSLLNGTRFVTISCQCPSRLCS